MEKINKCFVSAECFDDIDRFMKTMNYRELLSFKITCTDTTFLSCYFEFKTTLNKKEIIKKLNTVSDSHRMIETLAVHECLIA